MQIAVKNVKCRSSQTLADQSIAEIAGRKEKAAEDDKHTCAPTDCALAGARLNAETDKPKNKSAITMPETIPFNFSAFFRMIKARAEGLSVIGFEQNCFIHKSL